MSLILQKQNASDLTMRAMTKAFIEMKRAVSVSRPGTAADSTVGNILGVAVPGEDVPAICAIEEKLGNQNLRQKVVCNFLHTNY